ncbi:hypothetical protein [Desulfobacca acetoxidans]
MTTRLNTYGGKNIKNIFFLIAAFFFFLSYSSECSEVKDFPIFYWKQIEHNIKGHWSGKDQLDWQKIRKRRELKSTAVGITKLFELRCLNFRELSSELNGRNGFLTARTIILIRDPDGRINQISGAALEKISVKIPDDEYLNGRYLLGAHCDLGGMDINEDGRLEMVHLYTKHLVLHHKPNGRMGTSPDVFFNDVKRMPFEVGPALSTSDCRFSGGTQKPHIRYKMMVRYLNNPLSNVKVTVIAEDSRWQKTYVTNNTGNFEIELFDDRYMDRAWQRYLYVATHYDIDRNTFHIATMPVMVHQNLPEWRSQTIGFIFWSILGSTGCFLLIIVLAQRKRELKKKALLSFENYRIKKD